MTFDMGRVLNQSLKLLHGEKDVLDVHNVFAIHRDKGARGDCNSVQVLDCRTMAHKQPRTWHQSTGHEELLGIATLSAGAK